MNNEADPNLPLTEPGTATAEQGFVILDGPDGLAITLTAAAAAGTGRNLLSAAERAEKQAAEQRRSDDEAG